MVSQSPFPFHEREVLGGIDGVLSSAVLSIPVQQLANVSRGVNPDIFALAVHLVIQDVIL